MTLTSLAQNDDTLEVNLSITTPALQFAGWDDDTIKRAQLSVTTDDRTKSVFISSATFGTRMRLTERGTPITIDTATLSFPAGRKEWTLDAIDLVIGEKTKLRFESRSAERFVPFSWDQVKGDVPLDIEVSAADTTYAPFPMHVLGIRKTEDLKLELRVAFENAHRMPVKWKGSLNGGKLRLLTTDGAMLIPSSVSDSLRQSVMPTVDYVPSGKRNTGTVWFPMLTPDEARRFTIALPAYRPVTLSFDASAGQWRAEKATAASPNWNSADATLSKERNFTEVRAFLTDVFKQAGDGDLEDFVARHSAVMRDEAHQFAQGARTAGVTELTCTLDPRLEVVIDDESTKPLKVSVHYKLAALGQEHEFAFDASVRVKRVKSGGWQITEIKYPLQTPFWLVGYTASKRTEHFTVFHLSNRDGAKQAEDTGRDLERAYESLTGQGLKLRDRYAAFAITRADDFLKLTSRNPGTFSGVASMRQVFRDGRLVNFNQAIFINDPRFSFLERLMRRQDHRETITHELVHLAFANTSMPWTPAWLEEGLAMYFSGEFGRGEAQDLRQLLTPGVNLKNMTIVPYLGYGTDKSPAATSAQYLMSAATVNWLVAKHGAPAVVQFHRTMAGIAASEWKRFAGNVDQDKAALRRLELTREAVKKHFNVSLDELDAAVRSSL